MYINIQSYDYNYALKVWDSLLCFISVMQKNVLVMFFFPFHLSAVYWLAILLYFYGPYGLINSDAYAFFKIELLVVWCCLGVSRDLGIIPLGQGHQIALLASLDKLQRK